MLSRITCSTAELWMPSDIRGDPESTLMPESAPCAGVAEEVKALAGFVRVSRLMSELAAATAPPADHIPLPRKKFRDQSRRIAANQAKPSMPVTTSLACARIPCR